MISNSGIASKRLYESMSAVHNALPATLQEEFVELIQRLSFGEAGTYGLVLRWKKDYGYRPQS